MTLGQKSQASVASSIRGGKRGQFFARGVDMAWMISTARPRGGGFLIVQIVMEPAVPAICFEA